MNRWTRSEQAGRLQMSCQEVGGGKAGWARGIARAARRALVERTNSRLLSPAQRGGEIDLLGSMAKWARMGKGEQGPSLGSRARNTARWRLRRSAPERILQLGGWKMGRAIQKDAVVNAFLGCIWKLPFWPSPGGRSLVELLPGPGSGPAGGLEITEVKMGAALVDPLRQKRAACLCAPMTVRMRLRASSLRKPLRRGGPLKDSRCPAGWPGGKRRHGGGNEVTGRGRILRARGQVGGSSSAGRAKCALDGGPRIGFGS